MATKETLKIKAARVREEARETGKVILRAPALVRSAECGIRFLLGAMLSGAEIFGGYAPFGLGLVASSGSGVDGFCALLGACLGYLSFQGFAEGLRYVAACILAYSVAFAFFDVKAYRRAWFMPLAAAGMDAVTGFVYLSDRGWTPENVIFFGTELLLCGAATYFYRIAFTPWTGQREEEELTARQTVSLLILMGTLLITLSKITLFGDLSVGRTAAALAVMAAAYKGGIGVGATLGVAAGLGMDLAAGETPFYCMTYALSGVMCGVFHRQGKLAAALAYVLSNALGVLWTWQQGLQVSLLYEVFIASVVFLLLPEQVLRRVGAMVGQPPQRGTRERAGAYVRQRLEDTAGAFRGLYESMRTSFGRPAPNDNDAAAVFDRAAARVCRRCPLQNACWQRDYISTFNALNDALPAMLERGRGEGGDFPAYFSNRCMHFSDFLSAANEELSALLCRRQYQSRLKENRAAVCRQYAELAGVLGAAAAELGAELVPDPVREKRLRQYLTAQGVECEVGAYYDEAGHLRIELEGAGLSAVRKSESVEKISKLMNFPLRAVDQTRRDQLLLVQSEPLMAVAGVAARKKDGQTVSGDAGAWFKHDDGSLYVLLCDGMGSGVLAERESSLAVRLLEQFLRAGIRPENALKTLSSALALRNEEEAGGFTTIDLMRVDLFTGETGVYKYGAAPTYVKKGGSVQRITGSALPAGLAGGDGAAPDVTRLQLEGGDCVVLVSDGVCGTGADQWVRDRLSAFDGGSPKDLAQALIDESGERVGAADDRTALVLKLVRR
ncbi:SpoIIE family protein phosphatase [Flavonifractor hominis]|uniref:SpoIIE family protein phosphatase n=1 Tax=Flavonifractor hominis TaxID=3133178 RepID=A0ABV1EMC4_9FIRM